MNYATIKYCDIANGEGVRTSLFVSGCRRHCPNCFNAVAWDFNYGAPFTDAVKEQIIESLAPGYINVHRHHHRGVLPRHGLRRGRHRGLHVPLGRGPA